LAKSQTRITRTLWRELRAWQDATNAPVPTTNPDADKNNPHNPHPEAHVH